jgi:predicted TPR repeat methyltransferase
VLVSDSYEDVLGDLIDAYDAMVGTREGRPAEEWKQAERSGFLARLLHDDLRRLLEVGAGTGLHGKWFSDSGLEVVCTDASPAMVEACRAKGLNALRVDFLGLERDWRFDAVFAMNCLLHVPPVDLPVVLRAIHNVLDAGGLFYWGQYGGIDRAGTYERDVYEPKRFFSYLSDASITRVASDLFEVVDFHTVEVDVEPGVHFQALTLRTPASVDGRR